MFPGDSGQMYTIAGNSKPGHALWVRSTPGTNDEHQGNHARQRGENGLRRHCRYVDALIETGRSLVADGADGLSTTCGFLSLFQEEIARAVNVPVASSSLMQVPFVQKLLPPDQQVGVITISRESLTTDHLAAAGAPQDTPVVGTENGREFTRVILEDEAQMNVDACRQDLLDAGAQLVREHPQVGAVVLECTNMGPYAADLRQTLGLPIFSIITFVSWFQSGLLPRRFSGITDDPR